VWLKVSHACVGNAIADHWHVRADNVEKVIS
jgi:hypothetical protein